MQDESTETVYRKSRPTRRSRAPILDESSTKESNSATITSHGTLSNVDNTFYRGNSVVPGRVTREPYRDITTSASENIKNRSVTNANESKTSVANSSASTIFNRTSGRARINRSHLDNMSGTDTVNNTRNETLASEKTFFNRANRLNASHAMTDSSVDTNIDKSSFHSNFQNDEFSTTKFVRNQRASNIQSLTNVSELEAMNSIENSTPQGNRSRLDATSFQREFHGRQVLSRSTLSMNQSNRSTTDVTLGHSISTPLSDMHPIFESTKIVSASRELINDTRSSINSVEDDRRQVAKNTQQSVGITKPGEITQNTEFSKIQLTQNDESIAKTDQLEKTGDLSASDLQDLNLLNQVSDEKSNKLQMSTRIKNMGMENSELEFNTFKPSASTNLSDNPAPSSQSYNQSVSTQFQREGRMDLSDAESSQQTNQEISVNHNTNNSDASTKFQKEAREKEKESSLQTSDIQNSVEQQQISTEQISNLDVLPTDHQVSVQTNNTSSASTKFQRELRLSQNGFSNLTGPTLQNSVEQQQISVQTNNTSSASTKFQREPRLSQNASSNLTGPKTSLDQSCSTQFQKNDKIRMPAPDISNIESCDSTKMFMADSTVNNTTANNSTVSNSTVNNSTVNDTTGNNTSIKNTTHGEDSIDPYAAENLEKLNETEYETAPEGSDEENEEEESESGDEKSDTLMSSDNDETNGSWREANSRDTTKSTVNGSRNESKNKSHHESQNKSRNKSKNTTVTSKTSSFGSGHIDTVSEIVQTEENSDMTDNHRNQSKNTTVTSKTACIGSEHSDTVSEIIQTEENSDMTDNHDSETNQSTDFSKSRMVLESSTKSTPSSTKSSKTSVSKVNQSRMDKTNMGMDFEEIEVVTKGGSSKQNLETGMHNLSVNVENNSDGNESDSSSGSEIDFNNPWSVFEKVDIDVNVLNELGSDEIRQIIRRDETKHREEQKKTTKHR